MSTSTCPKCGASNPPVARYCNACGSPLSAVPVPAPSIGYTTPPARPDNRYQYPADYWEVMRTGKINKTLTGLLVLVIGILISWIPIVGFIGGIVGFVGIILVLAGRDPFGPDHQRNTNLALIFFILGITVTASAFIATIVDSAIQIDAGVSQTSILSTYSFLFVIGGAIFGLSEVFLTYSLQRSNGHRLLWTAYGISVALGIIDPSILPFGSGVLFLIFYGTLSIITRSLGAIPAVLYATAFYLARKRISRQETPSPLSHGTGIPP